MVKAVRYFDVLQRQKGKLSQQTVAIDLRDHVFGSRAVVFEVLEASSFHRWKMVLCPEQLSFSACYTSLSVLIKTPLLRFTSIFLTVLPNSYNGKPT